MRWWRSRRWRETEALRSEAATWLADHGIYAYWLAGRRAMDAFLLGDFQEQERWHLIRREILAEIAPGATPDELSRLRFDGDPAHDPEQARMRMVGQRAGG